MQITTVTVPTAAQYMTSVFLQICHFRPMTQPNPLKAKILDPFPTQPFLHSVRSLRAWTDFPLFLLKSLLESTRSFNCSLAEIYPMIALVTLSGILPSM